jgi:hypothetical protein
MMSVGVLIGGLVLSAGSLARAGTTTVEVPGVPASTAFARRAQRSQLRRQAQATESKAAGSRAQADELRRSGAWAYKTGAVDRAERNATRYQTKASGQFAQARLPGAGMVDELAAPVPSSSEVAATERVERLRAQGGWAYKTGQVARAEANARELSASTPMPPPMYGQVEREPPTWNKPAAQAEEMHTFW